MKKSPIFSQNCPKWRQKSHQCVQMATSHTVWILHKWLNRAIVQI